MSFTTATSANNRGPSVSAPEPLNQTTDHAVSVPQLPVQATIFDVSDFIPTGDMDEAAETLERARALRDYLAKVSEYGFFEDAVAWAGLPHLPRGRAFVVNSGAPKLAIRLGWAVRTGGSHAAEVFLQSNSGIVRHYRRPTSVTP